MSRLQHPQVVIVEVDHGHRQLLEGALLEVEGLKLGDLARAHGADGEGQPGDTFEFGILVFVVRVGLSLIVVLGRVFTFVVFTLFVLFELQLLDQLLSQLGHLRLVLLKRVEDVEEGLHRGSIGRFLCRVVD